MATTTYPEAGAAPLAGTRPAQWSGPSRSGQRPGSEAPDQGDRQARRDHVIARVSATYRHRPIHPIARFS